MEGGALRTPEFKEFSKDLVMLLHVTTQIPDRKHDDLFPKKGGRGFPYFCVLDADGTVLAQHKGERTTDGFRATVAEARRYVDLKARAAAGEREARIDFCLLRGRLGHIPFEAVEAELKPLGELNDAQRALLRGLEADAIVKATLELEVGKKFAKMLDEGLVPQSDEAAGRFWNHIQVYAEATKDAKLFERWLEWTRARVGNNPGAKPWLDAMERKLAEMKGGN